MAGSKKILIVEDDQFIADMYARILQKNGYDVDFAYNGKQGVEQATKHQYDLIFLDIMMPQMTGIEALHQLREDGASNSQAKIVILTNLGQDKASKEALEAKADGYLIKADIVPSQLLEITNKLLGGPAA